MVGVIVVFVTIAVAREGVRANAVAAGSNAAIVCTATLRSTAVTSEHALQSFASAASGRCGY